ncbi:MAG: 50S ribosomal protein L6 [Clostridia bacterium]|nr:50S ribosomal protein L6 [Clostridia bacterium]
MSRIGKMPITIPAGVKVDVTADNVITVKGAKETLTRALHPEMKVEIEGDTITIVRPSDNKMHRSLHGLTRTLVNNMVIGVTDGFVKNLEINGVGYRAAMSGKTLNLTLGYSHPVNFEAEAGITIEVPAPNQIVVKGADKERVGAVAAKIRSFRAPEPYKGKGIKYADEYIRRKEGKTGAKKK